MTEKSNTSFAFWCRTNCFALLLLFAVSPVDGAELNRSGSATSALFNEEEIPLMNRFVSPPPSARPWVFWFWMNGNISREGITADLEAMADKGFGGVVQFSSTLGIPAGPFAFGSPEWREMMLHALKEAKRLGLEFTLHQGAGYCGSSGPHVTPEMSMQTLTVSETEVSGPGLQTIALKTPPHRYDYYRDLAVYALPRPAAAIPRVDHYRRKAFYENKGPLRVPLSPSVATTIPLTELIRLDALPGPDGKLVWNVPHGEWTLLRVGHTTTGKLTVNGPEGGTGLEVDKMNRDPLKEHLNAYYFSLADAAGDAAPGSTHIDSWEVGAQNWTGRFPKHFRTLRGYEVMDWLPVAAAGWKLGSETESERFLFDFRRTIADLIAREYFGAMRDFAGERGHYLSVQGYGAGNLDNLLVSRAGQVPQAEFWIGTADRHYRRGPLAESAARMQGRSIAGAEAFTTGEICGKWQQHPGSLKVLGDRYFARGVNLFFFHRYVLQPWMNRYPGMTYGRFGIHLDRTNTWFDEADAYYDYIRRCQAVLQARAPKDSLILRGDDIPSDAVRPPYAISRHYDCMFGLPEDLRVLEVRDGRLYHPSGYDFALLVLPDEETMSLEVLTEVERIVAAGGCVLGPAPKRAYGLLGYPGIDQEIQQRSGRLWGPGQSGFREHVGAGTVFWKMSVDDVFKKLGLPPVVEGQVPDGTPLSDAAVDEVLWARRTAEDGTAYFVSNQGDQPLLRTLTFRERADAVELWNPEDGSRVPLPYRTRTPDGRTAVRLHMEPGESLFLFFPKNAPETRAVESFTFNGKEARVPEPVPPPALSVERAVYGDGGRNNKNVTEFFRLKLARGGGPVRINPPAMDVRDPAPGKVKELRVFLRKGDEEIILTGRDGGTLTLPSPDAFETDGTTEASVNPLAPEVCLTPDGFSLRTHAAGLYELRDSAGNRVSKALPAAPDSMVLKGPWQIHFPQQAAYGSALPADRVLNRLIDWRKAEDDALKFFSGSAVYSIEFELPAELPREKLFAHLDLGGVGVLAHVSLNEKEMGGLWYPPFRMEVSGALRPGLNRLRVRVTNLWTNRLIGDAAKPAPMKFGSSGKDGRPLEWPDWVQGGSVPDTGRSTFTTWRFYEADDALQPSGLIGPVALHFQRETPVYLKP